LKVKEDEAGRHVTMQTATRTARHAALAVPLALNKRGGDGWELVSVLGGQTGAALPAPGTYIFKRPK
jgi:hypothetical protein